MNRGFVPALGTPLDSNGRLCKESYAKQIERMIEAGAVGLLSMGSMGQQAFISNDVCVEVAETAVKAAAGRVPVFVGAMDNSIKRAKARIASMEHLDVTAFVLTTPYYEIDTPAQVEKYFSEVAKSTKHNIMLYDLPGVTNYKITYDMVCRLKKEIPNLIGIKSADVQMLRKIRLNPEFEGFNTFCSNLDIFDVIYPWGIGSILDGMFTCTPVNGQKLVECMNKGDREGAAEALTNIVALRDKLLELDLWPAYSAAMNLLGFEGIHAPDWITESDDEVIAAVKAEMERIGEL
ncbi:MAG: dihydrodipicolinate synthase family protein [Eubacteriales bacterium]|nr:dihydrodipicolinate synthase family protein [Eubacteriales bacterium]